MPLIFTFLIVPQAQRSSSETLISLDAPQTMRSLSLPLFKRSALFPLRSPCLE